ncbi:MAG: hypothetical protein D6766_07145 [Verrucomicrobia bacterium]|nr:MAG: hypothetical protein D6766_07145 [Verrucomicrobiota bacterium]
MQPTVHAGRYIYFRIDDSFKWADSMLVEVEVEYFDHAGGSFTIEYDGSDPNAPFSGAYTRAGKTVSLTGSGTWKTATFRLPGARFLNGQNAGTDFRLAIQAPAFHVARVEVRRLGVPAEAGETVPGRQASLESLAPPDWVVLPGEGPPPVVRKGVLSLSGGDPPARLCFPTALFHGTGEELLARVRVRGLQGTETGAGALGVGGDEGKPWVARLEWVVGPERGWRLSAEAAGASAFQARTWLPNTWYWMRFRYTWQEVGGYPDVWVRLWRADGETIEPVTWDLTLDLAGLAPPPEGWLALEAPLAGDAVLETDFLFVRAANESAVTVRLPPLPPAWIELDPPVPVPDGGLRLTLEGAPRSAYLIERTADFVQWEPAPLMTDLLGRAHWLDAAAPGRRWAFYRAREAN